VIDVPQGFSGLWFRSAQALYAWQLIVVRIPGVKVEASRRGDMRCGVSASTSAINAASTLAYSDATPSSTTGGLAIVGGAESVTIQLADTTPARLSSTVTCEVWWLMPTGLWAHNPSDDFDSAGRGDADASHDVEVYDAPPNASRIYLKRTNSATGWQGNVMFGLWGS
jgi:hypothetical protein